MVLTLAAGGPECDSGIVKKKFSLRTATDRKQKLEMFLCRFKIQDKL